MSGALSSPGFDPAIALQAGRNLPPPANPLQTIGQFATVQNAINQNKMFPGQMELQQQRISANKADLLQTWKQAAARQLAPLLAEGANPTLADATTTLARLESQGMSTHEPLAALSSMTDGPNFRTQLGTWISANLATPGNEVGAVLGRPATRDTGLAIESGIERPLFSPTPGGFVPSTSTPVYPSRAAQMGRISGPPGPNGEPTSVPIGPVTPPSLTGLPPMGTGRPLPPALRNPNAPPSNGGDQPAPGPSSTGPNAPVTIPPTGPAPPMIPGQMTTGVGPAKQQQMTSQGQTSDAGFQKISDEGVRARGQDALLANMQTDLNMFTSGTNADKTLGFKRFLQSWGGPMGATFGVDPKSVAGQESFDKLANQLADAQGAGSDARLHVNQGANPSSSLSPEGADFILKQLRGNADYQRARQQLAAKHPDQTDLRGFEANVAKNLDPRVFQYARLNAEQKHNYYLGIKDEKDREAFKKSWAWATKNLEGFNGG